MKRPISNYPFLILIFALLLSACTVPPPPPTPTVEPPRATKTPLILPATWTPGPPTETLLPPTPYPTHTATPEPTLAPTFPPSPTAFPPVRVATADDHPFPPYSLLFLERGVVREWKLDGTVADLVALAGTTDRLDRVQMFDASLGGALVAILRQNIVGETEIVLYDRAARAIRWAKTLPASKVTALEISADNFWLAYATSGTEVEPGIVEAILMETPDQTVAIGECVPACVSLLWRPNSGFLAWSDDTGIWQGDPLLGSGQIPEMLAEPPVEVLVSGGPNVTGVYTIISFSPSGRFILLSKGPIPDTLPTVFDTLTGQRADVPGSFLYTDPGTNMAWLFNDLLVVGRAGLAAEERPLIEVYQMAPETESFFIRADAFPVGTSPSQAPFVLERLGDGAVRFALLDFSSPHYSPGNGIYFLDTRFDELFPLNALPFIRAREALWVPDGSGVLLLTANKTYYVPTDGGLIYEVDAYIGVSACCFAWAP